MLRRDKSTHTAGQYKVSHRCRTRIGIEITYCSEIRPQYQRLRKGIAEVPMDFLTSADTTFEARLEEERLNCCARFARPVDRLAKFSD